MARIAFTGRVVAGNIDIVSGKPRIELQINEKSDFLEQFDGIKDIPVLDIQIAPHRKKRSLDANAYAWVLIDKLAECNGVTKEEVYREAIRNVGGNSSIVCVESGKSDELRAGWAKHGLGWITEVMPSKIMGCVNMILYYGSSTYDTAQMSRLINNLVQDCDALGIQTKTPNEIVNLLSLWEKKGK